MSTPEQPPPYGYGPPYPYGPPPAGMAYWTPAAPPAPVQPAPAQPSTPAHAGVALAIVGLVFSWVPLLGTALGVAGIIFGLKAWRLADAGHDSPRSLGTAAIVIASVALGINLIAIAGVALSLAAAAAT